jgi:hypothetical protein
MENKIIVNTNHNEICNKIIKSLAHYLEFNQTIVLNSIYMKFKTNLRNFSSLLNI